MPKRNYGQAKRQRELSREQKKAEKLQRKLDRIDDSSPPEADASESDVPHRPPAS